MSRIGTYVQSSVMAGESYKAYYDHLQSVRETGDWESWIKFFLTGIIDTATQATETAQSIIQLFNNDRSMIENSGKSGAAILTIHTYLQQHPISNTASIRDKTTLSHPTIMRSLLALEEMGVVKEVTGKERNKIFVYGEYLDILKQGTEPLSY